MTTIVVQIADFYRHLWFMLCDDIHLTPDFAILLGLI
jgi:hypothetical protein